MIDWLIALILLPWQHKLLTCVPLYYDSVAAPNKPYDATIRYWYLTISFIAVRRLPFCVSIKTAI